MAELGTHLRIEGLPQVQHVEVCEELMTKVCAAARLTLSRGCQSNLKPNEWAICCRGDGTFGQKIAIQLDSVEALKALIT